MKDALRFPYQKQGKLWLPLIPLRLADRVDTQALVDSGASISVFSSEFIPILGLHLERGVQRFLEGVGGRILAYEHAVWITVAGIRIRCRICFSPELKTSLNILGQEGFFSHFLITFDRAGKKFLFAEKILTKRLPDVL